MSRSVLLIAGQEPVMRTTFRDHGRAYWSAEFALILEKHGWLDFETAGPEVLADPSHLEDRKVVIVAWLPETHWRADYVSTLCGYRGLLVLEGPFPPLVEEMLGVSRAGQATVGRSGPLTFSDKARGLVENRFGRVFGIGHRSGPDPSLQVAPSGEPNPLVLSPRESRTRRPGLSRANFSVAEPGPFSEMVGRAAVSMILAYRARFARHGRFFDDALEDALALLAVVRCYWLAAPGALQAALAELVREAAGRPAAEAGEENAAAARAVWGLALAEGAEASAARALVERARTVLPDARGDGLGRPAPASLLSRWRVLLALALSRGGIGVADPTAVALVDAFLPAPGSGTSALQAWLDLSVSEALAQRTQPQALQRSVQWLDTLDAALGGSGDGKLSAEFEGLTIADLALVLGALHRAGHRTSAKRLWRVIVETLYDARQGMFMNGSVIGERLVPDLGFAGSPLVALGLLSALDALEVTDVATESLSGYSSAQRAAWSAAPYVFQPYAGVDDDDCLVSLADVDPALPAMWRRRNVLATSFQLLAHLVHVHTVEPLAEPFVDFRSGDAIALEYLLMDALEAALAEGEPAVALVAAWPWGKRFAVTIRHDVDRLLSAEEFSRLVDLERSHALAVSWFWLPDRLHAEQLQALEREPGHEVALHAVRLDQKDAELAAVARGISAPIRGEAIHGAGDGWLGHLSVRAARAAGLLYTELAPPIADRPYGRYPWVDANGVVGSERIVGVSYNVSIDGMLGTRPGSEGGPGTYYQLLNHPDLNFDRLRGWIEALPRDGRLDWTCLEVARWWRATHDAEGLSIEPVPSEGGDLSRFSVRARAAVEDLELRLPCRPGSVREVLLDGGAAEWAEGEDPARSGIRVRVSLEPGRPRELAVIHHQGGGFAATR